MKKLFAASAFVGGLFLTSAAFAADCTTTVKKDDLTDDQVQALYDCIKAELREGYASKDGALTKEYTGWKAASTLPAAPGVHGKRFLMTFVNDAGFDEYVKFFNDKNEPVIIYDYLKEKPEGQKLIKKQKIYNNLLIKLLNTKSIITQFKSRHLNNLRLNNYIKKQN